MRGWKEVLFTDHYEISSGLSKPATEFGFGYPFLSFKNVFENYFIPEDLNQLVNANEKERKSCSIKKGDIFLTRTSETKEELGMSCVALNDYENATFNGFTKRLRPKTKNEIDPYFIGFYLRSPKFRSDISAFANLITRASLNNDAIGRLKLFLPPLNIQEKIGSILFSYNRLIENNLKRIKLLEEVAQRTYEEWFVKFRINGEQLAIDEMTGLPVGWERKKLNQVANIISGFPFKSSDYIENGCYKIVTIKNVQDGYFVPNTTDSLIEIPSKVKKEQELNTGDIILSLTGNVGRTCLVYGDNYLLNQRVAKLIAKENFSFGFVYATMRNQKMLTTLENISNGAAQQNLSPNNMGNVDVVCPDENTLSKFNDISDSSIKMICKLYLQNQKLKESRDILLPKLMNGTLNIES